MKELFFRTNSKVENLIGRELITNNTIAIFELVKNSYDAGSSKVEIKFVDFLKSNNNSVISTEDSYIEIRDNGCGMTFQEIKDYWMELGTPHKEEKKEVRIRDNQIKTVVNRIVNGEKGIGRFGVDKIGSKLLLESTSLAEEKKTVVYFDWNRFNDRSKLLEQIPCEYDLVDKDPKDVTGLNLKISNLRDEWVTKDIDDLKRDLKKFLSPIEEENNDFKIFFEYIYTENGEVINEKERIVNDSYEYLKTNIFAEIDTNGLVNFEIVDNGIVTERHEYLHSDGAKFGAAKIQIYYVDTVDKSIFTKKMGLRTSDYGNVKIFKDNFRIMPYGEPHNDWLEIDKRHAQGLFRTFGTRDLIGHILLSNDPGNGNNILKEATDRVGFIEDVPEFSNLKSFVWEIIKHLESYIFNRIKEQTKETTKILQEESISIKNEAQDLLTTFNNIISSTDLPKDQKDVIFKEIQSKSKEFNKKIKNIENASKQIESQIKIFSQITSKEGILFDMLHAIKNKLSVIDAQIMGFELDINDAGLDIKTDTLRIAFSDIYKFVDESLNKVKSSKLIKEKNNIQDVIDEALDFHNIKLKKENITLITKPLNETTFVKCSKEAIKNVFDNLFSNSIKALSKITNKTITIESILRDNNIEIYFSDNGSGIPEDKIPFIFSLWSSNTGGSGIGLASARDIIEDHGGKILVADLKKENISTTFLIKIPIVG